MARLVAVGQASTTRGGAGSCVTRGGACGRGRRVRRRQCRLGTIRQTASTGFGSGASAVDGGEPVVFGVVRLQPGGRMGVEIVCPRPQRSGRQAWMCAPHQEVAMVLQEKHLRAPLNRRWVRGRSMSRLFSPGL